MPKKNNILGDKLFIAGAGGQGILQLGRIIAQSACNEDMYTTYYPSYGAEVRGGVVNCTVIISDKEIVSPVVIKPETIIIMNNPSIIKFTNKIYSCKLLLINSSLISDFEQKKCNKETLVIKIPASEIAQNVGDIRCANMVMLGAYIKIKKIFSKTTVISVIKEVFKSKPDIINFNIETLEKGYLYV